MSPVPGTTKSNLLTTHYHQVYAVPLLLHAAPRYLRCHDYLTAHCRREKYTISSAYYDISGTLCDTLPGVVHWDGTQGTPVEDTCMESNCIYGQLPSGTFRTIGPFIYAHDHVLQ